LNVKLFIFSQWYWKANAFCPFYEGNTLPKVEENQFIINTLGNWDFGPNMTGDITHPDYPEYLTNVCHKQLTLLVTADCRADLYRRGSTMSWLHLRQTVATLKLLHSGKKEF